MPGQVTSISEGENRTLVATGRSAWAFDAEGNRSFIANSPSSIGGLLDYRGRALFGTQLGHRSSAADPSMLESLSPVHPWVGLSLVDETLFSFSGNALRRFSEADFSALERRPPDVVTVSSGNGFLRGASRSFPSPDGLLLATGSGEVFHTGDLSWAGYLNGGVQDVVFVDGGLFAVRRTEIVRYDERLLPVGRLEIDGTLGAAADAGDVIVLEADEASANGIRVHTYPFDAFRPPARGGQPEPPPSLNVANTVLFAGGGVLYVARRNPDELYRYAIAERRFLPPLAMLGQPVAGTYRQASGDVLIAYSDGRVTRLDPSTLGETVLMNTAGPVVELEAGGAGILGIGAAITAHSHDGEPLLRTPLVEATATQRVTWPGGVAMSNHIASVRVVFDETGVPAVAGGPGVEFSRDSIVRRDGSRILTRFGAILGVDPVSRLGDHGYTWEKGWWGDQLLTVRHDGGETLAEATDVDAGVTALANRFTGFPMDLVPHADGFVLATSVGPRTQLYFLDHELRTLHSEPAATPVVDLVGDAALNRQTGLYEQRVRFTNDSGAEVSGFRLGLPFLAASYELYNGSGTGEVFFDQPVAAGGSVDLTLEFYSPLRSGFVAGAVSHSTVLRELGAPAPPTAPFAIDRLLVLDDGSALIEFPSEPGVRYFVQTSGDGEGWSDCQFPVRAGGTRVQWIDNGPPKTPSHPSESPGRQYRVIRIDP